MIFKRGRKRGSESAVEESTEDVGVDELDESAEADQESAAEDVADEDFTALEPGTVEHKSYVADVGLIGSRDVKGGSGAEILTDVKTGVRESSMPSGKLCQA